MNSVLETSCWSPCQKRLNDLKYKIMLIGRDLIAIRYINSVLETSGWFLCQQWVNNLKYKMIYIASDLIALSSTKYGVLGS